MTKTAISLKKKTEVEGEKHSAEEKLLQGTPIHLHHYRA